MPKPARTDLTEWTTAELQEEFDVLGFSMGLVVVRRKSDDVIGSMTFHRTADNRRVYTDWKQDQP